jgi:citrate synthase
MTQPKSVTGSLDAIRTDIASNDLHNIWIRGQNLTGDVLGNRTFTEVVYLLIAKRLPEPNELRMADALLVSLMEHGLTPSAMVARVTYTTAPESLQGAVAAGLLGAGGLVLGSMEDCGKILTRVAGETRAGSAIPEVIASIVEEYRAEHRHIPGVGHAIHTEGDPRAARLFELAMEYGFAGQHVEAVKELAEQAGRDRHLPVNVTGAVAAILLELGIPWQLHRGFALISRSAGLVGHIGEELEQPITQAIRGLLRSAERDASIG